MSGTGPRIPVNRQAVPTRDQRYGSSGRGPRINPSHVLVIALFGVFLLGAAGFVALALNPAASPSPGALPSGATSDSSGHPGPSSATTGGRTSAPGDSADPGSSTYPGATDGSSATQGPGGSGSTETPDPGATPTPVPTPAPSGSVAMPMVPVVDFWSTATNISQRDLISALKGNNGSYPRVVVSGADRAAIAGALGITIASSVQSGDASAIQTAVKNGALGLMRAADVGPTVRALSLDGTSLFGETRVRKLSDWPLSVNIPAAQGQTWNQAASWTMVAGGDMFLDRGVRNTVVNHGKGVDYPFDGGTALVTGHYCCAPSAVQALVPSYVRTGNAGVVRQFVKSADLAIANLENPIPDNPTFHTSGFIFGGQPALLKMFTDAGIDWVSLANNHIKDYGAAGITETRTNLQKAGVPFGGAGKNIQQAGQISYLKAKGLKIAIIACVGVGQAAWAHGTSIAGGLPCKDVYVLPRIAAAKANADLVIVFAHWGIEYNRNPMPSQQKLAKDWIDAGAGLILGSHPHVYGALEQIDGKMVIYSMGNFIFDQYWSTATMEGALTEITFEGTRVVQIRLHPMIILDQAQPNFLNPATDDGKVLMKAIRQASGKVGF